MKKVLSIFLALTCLFSSAAPGSIIFASGGTSHTKRSSPKAPRPPKPERKPYEPTKDTLRKKDLIKQKAFLTALACLNGADVNIKLHKITKKESLNFTVIQVNNSAVTVKTNAAHSVQLEALMVSFEKENNDIDVEIDTPYYRCITNFIKINGKVLKIEEVLEYGDKVLNLICEKKEKFSPNYTTEIEENLTTDTSFMSQIMVLFQDILCSSENSGQTTSEKETESPKDSKDVFSNHMKELISLISQKAFLTALLCLNDSNVYIKYHRDGRCKSINFTITQIDNSSIPCISYYNIGTEMKALSTALKNKKGKINYKLKKKSYGLKARKAEVNGHTLSDQDIEEFGRKILELLYERKKITHPSQPQKHVINLTNDYVFKDEAAKILGSILERKKSKKKSPQKNELKLPSILDSPKALSYYYRTQRFYVSQKALLSALLCLNDSNVFIRYDENPKYQSIDFTVTKIDDSNIDCNSCKMANQMEILSTTLENKKGNIDYSPKKKTTGFKIKKAEINGCIFSNQDIEELGNEILNLLYEKKQTAQQNETQKLVLNLNEDETFKDKAAKILSNILERKKATEKVPNKWVLNLNENENFKHKITKILNNISIKKIAEEKEPKKPKVKLPSILHTPETVSYYYKTKKFYNAQKALLAALLCLNGSDVYIKHNQNFAYKSFGFKTIKVDDFEINYDTYKLGSDVNVLSTLLESKKGKIDYRVEKKSSESKIETVVINGHTLFTQDILDLGYKILDLLYAEKNIAYQNSTLELTSNLSENTDFKDKATKILSNILEAKESEEKSPKKILKLPSIVNEKKILNYNERKRIDTTQKAFLTALICSLGMDVYISPHKNKKKEVTDFKVLKIGNEIINDRPRTKALIEFISKNQTNMNFIYEATPTDCIIEAARINGKLLMREDIIKLGEKALDMILTKCSTPRFLLGKIINLTADDLFAKGAKDLLKDELNYDSSTEDDPSFRAKYM